MSGGKVVRYAIRLIPRVHGKGILVMVDGEDLLDLQIKDDFFEVVRHSVDIAPVFVVLPVLEEGKIDRPEAFVNLLEPFVVASVAAHIHFSAGIFD